MTRLLQLRASREDFRCTFFPFAFTKEWDRDAEACDYCIEAQYLKEHDMESHYNAFSECVFCPPWSSSYFKWRDFLVSQISYTAAVRSLLQNNNDNWLQEIRKDKVSIS
ncbi:hypothetical protein NX059_003760 [Plenodomus lindquistii]|nr:hypothetical protein NX059_003760 [Plenodomus lindquistii]